jgi:hypothetical protein
MIAGAAAIPAGTFYALVSQKGYEGPKFALLAVVLGLLSAIAAWKFFDTKLFSQDFERSVSGASTTWSLVPATAVLAIALSQCPVIARTANSTFAAPQQPIRISIIVTMDPREQVIETTVLTYERGA